MIDRLLSVYLLEAVQQMPVVAVTGPRQSGKSTLVQRCFPNYTYRNLEDIEQRRFALNDPKGFLLDVGSQAIIDEVQYVPDLLSYMQVAVDQNNRPGQFIISGSQNLLLIWRK